MVLRTDIEPFTTLLIFIHCADTPLSQVRLELSVHERVYSRHICYVPVSSQAYIAYMNQNSAVKELCWGCWKLKFDSFHKSNILVIKEIPSDYINNMAFFNNLLYYFYEKRNMWQIEIKKIQGKSNAKFGTVIFDKKGHFVSTTIGTYMRSPVVTCDTWNRYSNTVNQILKKVYQKYSKANS